MILRTLIIAIALVSSASAAYSPKPGDRFPDLKFPSITGGEQVAVSSLTEKKLMLHLFASW